MDRELELLKNIAKKPMTYNRDINDHIMSCRIGIKFINEKDEKISEIIKQMHKQEEKIHKLRIQIVVKDEQIRQKDEEIARLKEEKLREIGSKDRKIKEQKDIIIEQYKLINNYING